MTNKSFLILETCPLRDIGKELSDIETILQNPPGGLHQQLGVSYVEEPAVVQGEHALPLLDFLCQNVSEMNPKWSDGSMLIQFNLIYLSTPWLFLDKSCFTLNLHGVLGSTNNTV